jgi:ribosomal protein L13E
LDKVRGEMKVITGKIIRRWRKGRGFCVGRIESLVVAAFF